MPNDRTLLGDATAHRFTEQKISEPNRAASPPRVAPKPSSTYRNGPHCHGGQRPSLRSTDAGLRRGCRTRQHGCGVVDYHEGLESLIQKPRDIVRKVNAQVVT